MIKIILFDIDDTLIDHRSAEKNALNWIHQHYFKNQISIHEFEDIWQKKTSKNWKLFETKILTFEEQQEQRIIDVWKDLKKNIKKNEARNIFNKYLIKYEKSWQAFDGVFELLTNLDIPIGILSNGSLKQQLKKLNNTNILQFFDTNNIYTSEEIGIAKPDLEIFKFLTKKLQLKTNEILYIGDKYKYDIEPAEKVGWNAVWVDYHLLGKNSDHKKAINIKELKLTIQEYGKNLFRNDK